MIITCDYCDAQFELDNYPEQLVDSKIRCIRCNAVLEVPGPPVEKHAEKTLVTHATLRDPEVSEKEKKFLRTNMSRKKQKKKNTPEMAEFERSTSESNDHSLSGKRYDAVIGGLPGTDDDLGLSPAGEARLKPEGMGDEKNEMLSLNDLEDTDVKDRPAGEKKLFLDFDLERMGIDTDSAEGLEDDHDGFDEMAPFVLEMDDAFSGDTDGETIMLDMDLDDESEIFEETAEKDRGKRRPHIVPRTLTGSSNSNGLSEEMDETEELASLPFELDDRISAVDRDGLLDLFMDVDGLKPIGKGSGRRFSEDDSLNLDIEDEDFDTDEEGLGRLPLELRNLEKALEEVADDLEEDAPFDDMGLSLDENLLLDLDLDFDDDEHGLATVTADSGGEATLKSDGISGGEESEALGLGLDENLLLDLDLDFDDDEHGPATVTVDGGEDALTMDSDLGLTPADEGLNPNEQPVLELDFDEETGENLLAASALQDAKSNPIELIVNIDDDDSGSSMDIPLDEEGDFSLELDLDASNEGAPVLTTKERASVEGSSSSTHIALDEEDGASLELDLDAFDEDGPVLTTKEGASVEGSSSTHIALDEEGDFSLELDLDLEDAGNTLSAEAAVKPAFLLLKDKDNILEAVGGGSESDEEFLFNMDPEKFKEAHDELAVTANLMDQEDGAGGTTSASDLKSTSSTSRDALRSSEVVEAVLRSSNHDARIHETVDRDDDFIDAFDMGIPTDEFEELKEKRGDRNKPEKIAIGEAGNGFVIAEEAPMGRPRMRMSVLILLSVFLCALMLGAYSFGLFKSDNVKSILYNIPFLKDYLPAPTERVGEIVTLEHMIQDRFVENEWVGTLFVISGSVQNEFSAPRSHIQVIGRLFSSGKKPAGVEIVYCGNTLTDAELNSLPPNELKARLGNKAGAQNSNIDVPSGKILPYMIVFDNIPETLEEFTVAVKGSLPSDR